MITLASEHNSRMLGSYWGTICVARRARRTQTAWRLRRPSLWCGATRRTRPRTCCRCCRPRCARRGWPARQTGWPPRQGRAARFERGARRLARRGARCLTQRGARRLARRGARRLTQRGARRLAGVASPGGRRPRTPAAAAAGNALRTGAGRQARRAASPTLQKRGCAATHSQHRQDEAPGHLRVPPRLRLLLQGALHAQWLAGKASMRSASGQGRTLLATSCQGRHPVSYLLSSTDIAPTLHAVPGQAVANCREWSACLLLTNACMPGACVLHSMAVIGARQCFQHVGRDGSSDC